MTHSGRKILIISQVIPQWYVDVLTHSLGKDAEIDIITGSKINGKNVIESPSHDARSFKSRVVCWIKHFLFIKKWMHANKDKHYDLIFAISNPPVNSYVGLMLKRQFKAPFIYMNWDLYPQVIEHGIKSSIVRYVCNIWHQWNSRNYPEIDRMLTIGNVMAETMNNGLAHKIPVTILPISVDVNHLRPINKAQNPFCEKYGLTDKFVILYSGKMGIGHNIEMILETAVLLSEIKDIRFVFIGDGPKYAVTQQFISEHHSKNILLLPLQPDDIFPYSIACGDIGIVSQETSMAHLFMPSKTYSMMACGEAILGICSAHDDLHSLIADKDIGISITGNDARELASGIKQLYDNPELLVRYKSNARKVVEQFYSMEIMRESYRKLFNEVLHGQD